MSAGDAPPLADVVAEADRILAAAHAADVPLALIGGLAVRRLAGPAPHPALVRRFADIDVATVQGQGKAVGGLLTDLGYEAERQFNALNGHRRLLFHDAGNARQLDVFVGGFAMCHEVPITARLVPGAATIPAAELLLTKLQVVELNEKDRRDIVALLHHLDVTDDDTGINAGVVARLLAGDWGLWRTSRLNVERVGAALPGYELDADGRRRVQDRLDRLWDRVERQPKSGRWKLRARVGDRKRWYEEPEEVG